MTGKGLKPLGSYRSRLVLGYALVVAIVSIAWAWSLFGPLTNALVEQQKRSLLAIAQAASTLVETSGMTPQAVADNLGSQTGARITIVASDGKVLADSSENAAAMANHANRPEIESALDSRTGEARRISQTEGSEQLYVAVPSTSGGQRIAVRASEKVANIEAVVARPRRFGLALLAFALLAAGAIAVVVSRSLAEPLERLSDAARRMAEGDMGVEIPQPSGELGILAQSLTDLRVQIRQRINELETEERSLRSALDGLQDAVFLLGDHTIRFANEAASHLFGAPADGWQGRPVLQSGLPASLSTRMFDLATSTTPQTEEIGPDPTGRSLRLSGVPLGEIEGERRTLIAVSDITERSRLEQVRRDFVANASHELKTPVAGIQLLAMSAENAAEDGDDAQAMAFARQIEQESSRLQRLVVDLLELSRLEATPSPEALTDVRGAISNAVAGHNPVAVRRGLTLLVEDLAPAGEDVFASADPTDFAVALDNLLDNALAYTDSGRVTVRLEGDKGTVKIGVIDTGCGIPEAELDRIFERFYRVDRARSRDSGGTGLGLALVRHAVERSGGRVTVESVVGTGSTFELRFRRAG